MASFRRRGGSRPCWYYAFTDEDGRRVERKGSGSLAATKEMASAAETLVAKIKAGLEPSKAARERGLETEIAEWEQSLRDRGVTEKHIDRQVREVRRAAEDAGADVPSRLTAAAIQSALSRSRLSAQSRNHCRSAIRAFFRWLSAEGRWSRPLPTARVALQSVESDRRRRRRSLSAEEFAALLRSVETKDATRKGFSAKSRSLLYRLAAGTGLRAGELRSLTAGSFDLAGDPPQVMVPASRTKNRRTAKVPLYGDLAAMVAEWVRERRLKPDDSIWPASLPRETARDLLAPDLADAGIPYVTEDGAADFHSLRVYCATELVRANVPIATAMRFMRHSTPVLTLRTYAMVRDRELADAAGFLAVPLPCGNDPNCSDES